MTFSKQLLSVSLMCALLTASSVLAAKEGLTTGELDELVARTMDAFQVPGIAVGIVKDGQVILAKGYGVREIGKPGRVDADTMFGIGSNTKAFTTTALAILVDEGKISWDDRVIDRLPEFRLYDPYVTREFTIRDLVTHRSGLGLGAGDLMIIPEPDYTREEVLVALRHIKPASSFRSEYAYNNELYIVAGELIESVTNLSYDDFIEQRIFDPLDMKLCVAHRARLAETANVSQSHTISNGNVHTIAALYDIPLVAAPGGVWCSISGMVKWLQVHLGAGQIPNGKHLFSASQHQELWSAQTIMPLSKQSYEDHRTHFQLYGLGWITEDYRGYKRIYHGGGQGGMYTQLSFLPELGLGVFVLTNTDVDEPKELIIHQILYSYLSGVEPKDWVSIYSDRRAKRLAISDAMEAEVMADAGRSPSLPLDTYTGTYRDPWRGVATVRKEDGQLMLKFSRTEKLEGPLEHYNGNVFIVRWNDRSLLADAFVRFAFDFDNAVEGMTMKGVSPTMDFSYDYQNLEFKKVTVK